MVQVLSLGGGRSMGGTWGKGVFSERVSAPGRYLVLVTPFAAIRPARPEPMEVTAPADGIRIVCSTGCEALGQARGR